MSINVNEWCEGEVVAAYTVTAEQFDDVFRASDAATFRTAAGNAYLFPSLSSGGAGITVVSWPASCADAATLQGVVEQHVGNDVVTVDKLPGRYFGGKP